MINEAGEMNAAMWLAALLGGALGSGARHGMNLAMTRLVGTSAPYATASVNLVGSFVIGVLAGAIVSERLTMSEPLRVFVFVGIIGGFTTFSSFMLDSLMLLHAGAVGPAALNLVGQLIVGLALVAVGYHVGMGL